MDDKIFYIIKSIIDAIYEVYIKHTEAWQSKNSRQLNLKRVLVCDIVPGSDLWDMIWEYKEHLLNDNCVRDFISSLNCLQGLEINARIKTNKLVYYCFADYLCKYRKRMFGDKIYAFDYGPVVETVRERYIDKNQDINTGSEFYMAVRSRIIFSENGDKKLESIDNTLEKYGGSM